MSFSSNTKDALLAELPSKTCCKKALLMGILTFSNVYGRDKIKIVTENETAATAVCTLFTELYNVKYVMTSSENDKQTRTANPKERGKSYQITVTDRREISKMSDIFPKDTVSLYRINEKVFDRTCGKCASVFMRGAFISAGTVSRPESSFHLEISSPRKNLISDTVKLLNESGLNPHITQRNSNNVLYFKKCDDIADFLGFIGASAASFSYINESIVRESRSLANRAVNCDTANIRKTVNAAAQSMSAIKAIMDAGLLETLPPDLREAALLRYENPQASLNELSEISKPKLTKSGINHRLKRIIEFAKTIKREQ
ncbi:MAG: DNA-binding protein WhiA [Clostridia bacterium]|nr:DNA-binding protein WhiA [Clostridia bacterium]